MITLDELLKSINQEGMFVDKTATNHALHNLGAHKVV